MAGGAGGAALAAGIDLAAGGTSLGFFTALGGTIGALGAIHGGRTIGAKTKILGVHARRIQLQIGPCTNPQFAYILLDRALIYYSQIINWAHGRRSYEKNTSTPPPEGFLKNQPATTLMDLRGFIDAIRREVQPEEKTEQTFNDALMGILSTISSTDKTHDQDHYI